MHIRIKKFFIHTIANHSVLFFIGIIIFVVIIGSILFHIAEGRNFFDCFYFTSVTMSTIWYGDMAPATYGGKIIAMIYGFMGAPLFIGLTGLIFQSNFQKMVKSSIHAYHKEVKETEKLAEEVAKHNKIQDQKIEEIQEEIQEDEK